MIIPSQRHLFSLPRDICYLNAAYMTPHPIAVEEAGLAATSQRARPWQISQQDFFTDVERTRGLFAELLGTDADAIAITTAASTGIAIAARNLRPEKGQAILTVENQFPSHVLGWWRLAEETGAEVVVVPTPADGDWTAAVLSEMDGLGDRLAIAALPNYHWSNGAFVDLAAIGPEVRARGASLVVDASQSIAATPFPLAEADPDYMVAAGYKWQFCPYGISFLYVAERNQGGVPLEEGWINRQGSDDFSRLAGHQNDYMPGARRFDVGERAFFQMMPAAAAALELLLQWGVQNISETLAAHNERLTGIFAGAGYDVMDENLRAPHFMAVKAPGPHAAEFLDHLKSNGVYLSQRGPSLRVAPHLYNDDEDFSRLEAALAR